MGSSMKKSLLLLLALFNVSLGVAAPNDEAKCRQWASEDEVPAAQVASYVRECVADQATFPDPRLTGTKDFDNVAAFANKPTYPQSSQSDDRSITQ